jgi:hypothetical protein
MNRRKFLLLSSAAGSLAVVGGGAAFVITDHYRGWIRGILHRGLPGYSLEPKGLTQFGDEYFAKHRHARKQRVIAAAEGVMNLDAMVPAGMARRIALEEREILTDFLIGSDFFQNYPRGSKVITYSGKPAACTSPFATFGM